MDAFTSDAAGKIFHFEFEGEPRPLKPYLVERYQYGRAADWPATFYPARVRLNGATVAEDTWVQPGDTIAYRHLRAEEPPAPDTLAVLYEDDWLVAVHKPDSIPVSPSGLYYFSCMAILARERFGNEELTPVHRLDLETSGVLLLVRRRAHLAPFHRMFAEHRVAKRYLALVLGRFPAVPAQLSGRIAPHPASRIHTKLWVDARGASNALTRVLAAVPQGPFTELLVEPVSGKTNQIRVHLAHAGHAIVGDKKYHPDEGVFLDWLRHRDFERLRGALTLPRQALQCQSLSFVHPYSGEALTLSAPPGSWRDKIAPADVAPALG